MPKGKSPKGRRGGRKPVVTGPVERQESAVEEDLNSSHKTGDELELVEKDKNKEELTDIRPVDDDITSLKIEITTQTVECSANMKDCSNVDEEQISNEINKSGGQETVVKQCPKTMEKIIAAEEKPVSKSILHKDESIQKDKDYNETEVFISEQLEAKLLETADESGSTEEINTKIDFMHAEMDDQQKEDDLPCIAKSTNEDQQLLNVIENADMEKTNAALSTELHEQNEMEETGNKLDSNVILSTIAADLTKPSVVESEQVQEFENSKFEEISEGSIEQADQDDVIAESFSDVEITGESFEPKKIQNDKNGTNIIKGKAKVPYKESESLEAVFFATENDNVKVAAEDKDNDEISDTSLSDHIDADLSLEEISDDDLEPSKKRRKSSGQTPVKTGNDGKEVEEISDDDLEPSKKRRKSSGQTPVKTGNEGSEVENTKPDMTSASISDEMIEKVRSDKVDMMVQKWATDDNPNSNKRLKSSGEKNDAEVVSSSGEKEPTLSADIGGQSKNEEKRTQTKDYSYNRNVVHSNRNMSQSSRNWSQKNTEGSLSSRNFVTSRRKYDMVDSSCQSEPPLLKGKIVQCSITPIKSTAEFKKQETYAECDSTVSEFMNKFKLRFPSSVSDEVLSDVTSLQPSQKKGSYSFSIGPLILSHVVSSAFRDNLLSASENFSLIFDNHCQGIFKATFSKPDNVATVFTWLKHTELNNHQLIISVQEQENICVCKAILLFVNGHDMQTESQSMVSDEENEAKLYLTGVPKGVSTTFIHLLFPEAQNVVIDVEASNGIMKLDFSSTEMVDDILSSYGLLVVNGSQVILSRTKPLEDQQNVILSTGSSKELDTVIKEGTALEGKQSEKSELCTEYEQGTKSDTNQKEETQFDITDHLESEKSEQQPNQVVQKEIASDLGRDILSGNICSLTTDSTLDLDRGDNASYVPVMSESYSRHAVSDIAEGTNEADIAITIDHSAEMTIPRDENIANESAFEVNESKKQVEELQEEICSQSAKHSADSCERGDKDNSSSQVITEGANKLEASMQDNTLSEKQLITNEELKCEVGMSVQENDKVRTEKEINNSVGDIVYCKASDEQVNNDVTEASQKANDDVTDSSQKANDDVTDASQKANGDVTDASQKTNDENFEDVSDEEMVNQIKLEDLDEVVLREDSLKRRVANVDLSNDSVKTINKGSIIDPREEGGKKPDNQNQSRVSDGSKAEEPSGSGECMDSKLVMTDGDFEVSLEVIDVNSDSGEVKKVIYPRTWHMFQDRPTDATPYFVTTRKENTGNNSSYANKTGIFNRPRDPYRDPPADMHHYSWSSRRQSPSYRGPFIESTSQKRVSSPSKQRRSCSPSHRRYTDVYLHRHPHNYTAGHYRTSSTEHWSKSYESQHPETYGDTRKVDPRYKPVSESRSKPKDLHDRKSRSRSLSDMSESSNNEVPALSKSPYRRGSPKHPVLHTSRSPISISSRSHSLSPVSKSSSLDLPQTGDEKEELVKTVQHFLKIAKGIHQTRKRRHDQPKSYRLSSSQHSPPMSRSPYTRRSRNLKSVKSRHSRSPTYSRSSRYKNERSLSPVSYGESSKRRHEDKSFSDREYPRDSGHLRHELERSQRSGQNSYEQSGRSGKWPEQKYSEHYRSLSNQSWQQSYGGYQAPVPTSNVYNPSFPPPGCSPTEVQSSMYPGSSMPMYQYNNQSQYTYSNVPPPYVQTAPPLPPPSFAQPYQSYPSYQPRF